MPKPKFKFDVEEFRTNNKEKLLAQIYEMTETHFKLVDYCIKNKPWDFFMYTEIGTDRLHHGFWHYHDSKHFRYSQGNPFESEGNPFEI